MVILIAWFAITGYINNREDSASTALNLILGDINHFQSAGSNDDSQAEELVSKLKSIVADHGGTAASVAAKYYLASVYLKTENQEEAETLLKEVIDSRHPTFWQSAASDLGSILQTQEKFEEAASIKRVVATPLNSRAATGSAVQSWAFTPAVCINVSTAPQRCSSEWSSSQSI